MKKIDHLFGIYKIVRFYSIDDNVNFILSVLYAALLCYQSCNILIVMCPFNFIWIINYVFYYHAISSGGFH